MKKDFKVTIRIGVEMKHFVIYQSEQIEEHSLDLLVSSIEDYVRSRANKYLSAPLDTSEEDGGML
jgi:hypothetical protein